MPYATHPALQSAKIVSPEPVYNLLESALATQDFLHQIILAHRVEPSVPDVTQLENVWDVQIREEIPQKTAIAQTDFMKVEDLRV